MFYTILNHLPLICGVVTALISVLAYLNGKNNNAVSQLLQRLQGAEIQARSDQKRADDALALVSDLKAEVAKAENLAVLTQKENEIANLKMELRIEQSESKNKSQ